MEGTFGLARAGMSVLRRSQVAEQAPAAVGPDMAAVEVGGGGGHRLTEDDLLRLVIQRRPLRVSLAVGALVVGEHSIPAPGVSRKTSLLTNIPFSYISTDFAVPGSETFPAEFNSKEKGLLANNWKNPT
jgi:hypothetical protein